MKEKMKVKIVIRTNAEWDWEEDAVEADVFALCVQTAGARRKPAKIGGCFADWSEESASILQRRGGRRDQMKSIGRKAQATAKTIAGSRLATRIFLPTTRLMPTQKIRMLPITER